jgi:hypothetical protein
MTRVADLRQFKNFDFQFHHSERGAAMKRGTACAIATVIVAMTALNGFSTASAGLLPVNADAMKAAEPNETVDVRYNGAGAFFTGAALGFIVANSYRPYYYHPYRVYYPRYRYRRYYYRPYYYHPYYYYPSYYYYPRYYYRPRLHWGFGVWW